MATHTVLTVKPHPQRGVPMAADWVVGIGHSMFGFTPLTSYSEGNEYLFQAGRQRVLKEKQKNVHAFVTGTLIGLEGFVPFKGRTALVGYEGCVADHTPALTKAVSYNPYKRGSFFTKLDGRSIQSCTRGWVGIGGVFIQPRVICTQQELDL